MSEVAPDTAASPGAGLPTHTAPSSLVADVGLGASWRRIAGQAALMWLATRVALILLTAASFIFTTSGPYVNGGGPTGYDSITPHLLIRAWLRWDAPNYLNVALHGYAVPRDAAFFPLYPLLTGGLTALVGAGHQLLAALLVSNLGALAGFVGLALLAAHEAGAAASAAGSARSVRMLAVYPFAFLLAAPYADGLFLGVVIWALLLMRQGRWRWAAACVFLATLTRLEGVVVALPLLWEYATQTGWPRQLRSIGEAALVALAAPAGLALYAGYLALQLGQPFAFLQQISMYWDYTTPPLWTSLPNPASGVLVLPGWGYGSLLTAVSLTLFVGGAVLTVAVWRHLPTSFAIYTLGLLAAGLASLFFAHDAFRSSGVYLVAAAPLFLLLGRWSARRPGLDSILVVCGLLLQAVLALVWLSALRPA